MGRGSSIPKQMGRISSLSIVACSSMGMQVDTARHVPPCATGRAVRSRCRLQGGPAAVKTRRSSRAARVMCSPGGRARSTRGKQCGVSVVRTRCRCVARRDQPRSVHTLLVDVPARGHMSLEILLLGGRVRAGGGHGPRAHRAHRAHRARRPASPRSMWV